MAKDFNLDKVITTLATALANPDHALNALFQAIKTPAESAYGISMQKKLKIGDDLEVDYTIKGTDISSVDVVKIVEDELSSWYRAIKNDPRCESVLHGHRAVVTFHVGEDNTIVGNWNSQKDTFIVSTVCNGETFHAEYCPKDETLSDFRRPEDELEEPGNEQEYTAIPEKCEENDDEDKSETKEDDCEADCEHCEFRDQCDNLVAEDEDEDDEDDEDEDEEEDDEDEYTHPADCYTPNLKTLAGRMFMAANYSTPEIIAREIANAMIEGDENMTVLYDEDDILIGFEVTDKNLPLLKEVSTEDTDELSDAINDYIAPAKLQIDSDENHVIKVQLMLV